MKALFVLNAPPYGSEHTYNGLRFAGALAKREHNEVRIYLIGDAVGAAKQGQKVPQGYYDIGHMLDAVIRRKGAVAACGTCIDARGIADTDLVQGAQRSNMDILADWTEWADKVL